MMVLTQPSPLVRPIATARPAVLRIDRLAKRFAIPRPWATLLRGGAGPRRHTTALDDVSLTASRGEIVGLLGANGAGKTTLLKIVSTLILPDAGTVEIEGVDVVRSAGDARRLVSPVTADDRSLEWRLSAAENLRFFGTLHGLAGSDLRRRIDELLTAVELNDAGEKRVGTFSSGMKQRLLIARGLLSRPLVLLLDEPTRSLDPLAARAFRDFLRSEIAGRQGCTVLLATHDPDEALGLCDRIAILERGRVVAAGTARELVRTYGDERYRIWVQGDHSERVVLALAAGVRRRPELDGEGWGVSDIDIPPGDTSTTVLAMLVNNGISVGRFEKLQPTVADLMERVLRGDASVP